MIIRPEIRNVNSTSAIIFCRRLLIVFFISISCSIQVIAQDSTGTKEEVWPEINLYYKLNKEFRIFALYSATKLKNSSYSDGGYGIYMDYFAFPWLRMKLGSNFRDSTNGYYLWLRAGYLHSSTPPESADEFKENTFVTEFNLRYHLPYGILVTDKNRFDWRSINGSFEPRYRPRLVFEKDMRTDYMYFTPSIYAEYYIYFTESGLNRFRLHGGIQTKFTKHIEFETYFVHQFSNGKKVKALNAMGLVVKFYFNHRDIKKKFTD